MKPVAPHQRKRTARQPVDQVQVAHDGGNGDGPGAVLHVGHRLAVEVDVQAQHLEQARVEVQRRQQYAQRGGPDDGLGAQAEQGEGQAEDDQLAGLGGEYQGQQQKRGEDQIQRAAALGTIDRRRRLVPQLDAVEIAEADQERADGRAVRAVVGADFGAHVRDHPELEAPGEKRGEQRRVDQRTFELQRTDPLGQEQQRREARQNSTRRSSISP